MINQLVIPIGGMVALAAASIYYAEPQPDQPAQLAQAPAAPTESSASSQAAPAGTHAAPAIKVSQAVAASNGALSIAALPDPAPQKVAAVQTEEEKKTIATISLAGCFGCHMSLLDIDLKLMDLVELVDFNKSPLNDIKEFTKQCDIGLIEGGCCNTDNVEVLQEFRRKCDVLVCFGECAIWGGLPAMRNTIPLSECLEESYLNGISSMPDECLVPYDQDLPKILDKVYACNEIVEIDHFIPGCPPDANHIWKSVLNLLLGEQRCRNQDGNLFATMNCSKTRS